MKKTYNLNIASYHQLIKPEEMLAEIPLKDETAAFVTESREIVKAILRGEDKRFMVIAGPCSIHDEKAAIEYADRLADLHQRYKERIYILMRVYFEKPRTTIGWKGLINDPNLDGTYDVLAGLRKARKILLGVLERGLPTTTEFLDPIVPQYISDLVSWAAIGARTTESQTHRQMASGLSMPVGFKNNTDGNIQVAIDAIQSAANPHHFLGIDGKGVTSVVETKGNPDCHIILRGGKNKPNYDPETIKEVLSTLQGSEAGCDKIIIDCSHANSEKKHERQKIVFNSIVDQRAAGNENLIGLMLESNLNEGKQSLPDNLADLEYGVSITDACVNFKSTEELLENAFAKLTQTAPVLSK